MIHNRQFIITNKVFKREDFISIIIKEDLYLSYQKNLNITITETSIGKAILLGIAFPIFQEKKLENIKSLEDVKNWLANMSGRFVLIINENIFMDFSGSLGIYYGKQEKNIIISSSLALIKEMYVDIEDEKYVPLEKSKLGYFPVPLTPLKGIKKLICSEVLSFNKQDYKIEFKNYRQDFSYLNEEETYRMFIKCFSKLIKNISNNWEGTIFLPLTGGVDSRTLLSFLLKEKINFISYTAFHSKGLVISDRTVGKKLSKIYKFKHIFLKGKKLSKKIIERRVEEYNSQCYKTSVEEDRYYYSVDIYEDLKKYKKPLILRGNLWECTIKEEDLVEELKKFKKLDDEALKMLSLKLWENTVKKNKINIDYGMRFYLEQRMSGWSSCNSQAEDLNNIDFFSPINNEILISLLWNLPIYDGINNKTNQINIIKKIDENLLAIPINKKYRVDFIIKYLAFIKYNGIKEFIKKVILKICRGKNE